VGIPELFAWTLPPTELIARGTLIYLGLVLCFRYLLRRDIGSMSTADLLFVVLIADAAQNAMAGEYKSVGDGAVLVATLIFWNVVLDWLALSQPAPSAHPRAAPAAADREWPMDPREPEAAVDHHGGSRSETARARR
jgi:hypothetical protein